MSTSAERGPALERQPRAPRPPEAAACSASNGTLVALFFSDDDLDIARAKAICATCPRREACLEGALARGEAYGVWGGVLLIDGAPVRFPKRRGRPPRRRVEYVIGTGYREVA